MKLEVKTLRYLTSDDFRVLTAVEMGSKNHEIVPVHLIIQTANIRHGNVQRCIAELARRNLVAKECTSKYDGYRLTYGGYDYLALRALSKRGTVVSVGNQIGVGKESDIHVVADADGHERVLKIHRLGRTSFRTVKNNRDYLQGRHTASWMYLSRLSATKEVAFMRVLKEHGFPVPIPYDHNRHCVVMEFVDAFPLRQITEVAQPGKLYAELMDLIVRLAQSGLIHGDFNEFNILIKESGVPTLIDFPQMVSTSHANAEFYFNRDVECIRTYFRRRYRYESALYPKFTRDATREFSLDVKVSASGFNRKQLKELDEYYAERGEIAEGEGSEDEDEESSDDQEEEDGTESETGSEEQTTSDDEEGKTKPPTATPTTMSVPLVDELVTIDKAVGALTISD
ncbi:Serine/threonine-protein kinase rio2 [Tieghemiomyces parasiticus]|uniref:Serine/threonine-protein kinase RIO2 n=1 Tax=Tieghemiomyces parasiticus TaxID=78921 RepID=A0A9W7ZRG2_9FUNG|nr:Serine/threonine-protein kinase rio2 [Tieghemiomyces parasiticus]